MTSLINLWSQLTTSVMVQLFVVHATLVCVSLWLFVWYYIVHLHALNNVSLYEVERAHPPIPSALRTLLLIMGLSGCFVITLLSFRMRTVVLGPWDTFYFSSVFLFSIVIAVISQVKNKESKYLIRFCLAAVIITLAGLLISMFS